MGQSSMHGAIVGANNDAVLNGDGNENETVDDVVVMKVVSQTCPLKLHQTFVLPLKSHHQHCYFPWSHVFCRSGRGTWLVLFLPFSSQNPLQAPAPSNTNVVVLWHTSVVRSPINHVNVTWVWQSDMLLQVFLILPRPHFQLFLHSLLLPHSGPHSHPYCDSHCYPRYMLLILATKPLLIMIPS